MKEKNKKDFIVKILIMIVFAVIIGIILANVAFDGEVDQENKLNNQVEYLISKNITSDDYSNINPTTNGKYAIVEKAINEFFYDYSEALKNMSRDTADTQIDIDVKKALDLLSQESIMNRIENTNVSSEYIEVYRNLFYGDSNLAKWVESENDRLNSIKENVEKML